MRDDHTPGEREQSERTQRRNLDMARHMNQEMERDGTWAELKATVARQLPDREFERRFLVVRADGVPAPALMLRHEPWSEELADQWMAYLWESQRAGRFSVDVQSECEPGEVPIRVTGGELGVALAFIVDLESGRFFRGAPERRPQEAAALALKHYTAVVFPPGAVKLLDFRETGEEQQ